MWQISFFSRSLYPTIFIMHLWNQAYQKSRVHTLNSLQAQRRLIDYVKIGKEKKNQNL